MLGIHWVALAMNAHSAFGTIYMSGPLFIQKYYFVDKWTIKQMNRLLNYSNLNKGFPHFDQED